MNKKVALENDIESARLRGNWPLVTLLAAKYNKKYATILDVVASIDAEHQTSLQAALGNLSWDSVTPNSIAEFLTNTHLLLGGVVDLNEHALQKLEHARNTLDYSLNFQANLLSASLFFHCGEITRACELACIFLLSFFDLLRQTP